MTKQQRIFYKDLIVSLIAIAIGLVIIFPVIYSVMVSFKTRAELSAFPPTVLPESFLNLENFRTVFNIVPIMRFMLNSVIVAVMGCILRVLFALLAAYAFCYFNFRGKTFLFGLILGTMMLPADALIITNYLTIVRLNMLDNYFAMVITSLVGATQMFMLRQNLKSIPTSFRDVASMDGCGDLRYIFHIVLPFSRPVIMILLVQSFISFWNMYLWPLLITNRIEMRTIQIGVAMLSNPLDINFTVVLAAVTILLIPSFILFVFLRLTINKAIESGALVG